MARQFDIVKATTPPELLRAPSPVIAKEVESRQPKRVTEIRSLSLFFAMRAADMVKLNARDLTSGVSDLFRPALNANTAAKSDVEIQAEYDEYSFEVLAAGKTPMTLGEYVSLRDKSSFQRLFIAINDAVGIEQDLTQDLA